ncbi:MAG: hypothetical protein ACYC27_02975 [Armatimonadota bacterium]
MEVREPDVVIEIPAIPPSKNKWIGVPRRVQKKVYFEPWNDRVMALALEARSDGREWPKIKGPVEIQVTFTFPNLKHPDVRNLDCFPPLIDILTADTHALTKTGIRHKRGLEIIEDDRPGILHWKETIVEYIPGCTPRTVIKIWRQSNES